MPGIVEQVAGMTEPVGVHDELAATHCHRRQTGVAGQRLDHDRDTDALEKGADRAGFRTVEPHRFVTRRGRRD
jgi:hypothetical protein